MNDIAPELLKNIQERFEFLMESNYRLRKLYEEAEKGTATYKEANKFALEVGNALAKSYKNELSSDVLPDGKMYYNIAHKIFDDTLRNNYNIVVDYCENVQNSLNEKTGISLKAIRPDLDEDRVRGFSELASNAEQYDDVAAPVEEAAINFTQNVVNDSIKKNAEFQYNAGFKAKVIRDSSSDCCAWCDNLVGEYSYPAVPKEVYQRHAHCRCTVEYEPSKGKRQNVHTRKIRLVDADSILNSQNYRQVEFSDKAVSIDRKGETYIVKEMTSAANKIFVSEGANLSPRYAHEIDNAISESLKLLKIDKAENLPQFIVLGKKEMETDVLASYNAYKNTMYINENIGNRKVLLDNQKDFAAAKKDISTYVHELFHWMDAEAYRKKNGTIDENYMNANIEICKKKLEKIVEDGYNINKISAYASKMLDADRFDEVYTEYRTLMRLMKI